MLQLNPTTFCLFFLLLTVPHSSAISQAAEDVCKSQSFDQLHGYIPTKAADAGTFYRLDEIARFSPVSCAQACCNTNITCHIAFIPDSGICHHISCRDWDSCQPVTVKGDEVNSNATFIWIRKPVTNTTHYEAKRCNPGKGCSTNERCEYPKAANVTSGICVCLAGYYRSAITANCHPVTKNQLQPLNVTVTGPTEVQLPQKEVVLMANVTGTGLKFYWEALTGDGLSYVASYERQILVLTNLSAGSLRFRVTVTNETHSGQSDHAFVIRSEKKPNRPPHAMIRPGSPVHGVEGSQVVLDAEGSSDEDGRIVSYQWQMLKGPTVQLPALNTGILKLDLHAGAYSFKSVFPVHQQPFRVTVTDDQGAQSEANVDVQVDYERDDPPKAQISRCGDKPAGSVTVRLPLEKLYLCGNGSTDDKGIVSYNWFRIDKLAAQLAVDNIGSNTAEYTLTNLRANEKFGPYVFRLEVTDTKGQKDETTVSVFVNKAENQAPVADAGGNHTVILPKNSVALDGDAKDDGSLIGYVWSQIDGPNQAKLLNADKAKSTVLDLEEGQYRFRLNVTDDGGLSASADTFVSVIRSKNQPPVAQATNLTLSLPAAVAILNGSQSTDDAGIVAYQWSPLDDVPACIMALDGSNTRPVLLLGGLVPGEFRFNFTIADQQGAQDSIIVQLKVISGESDLQSVEMYLVQRIDAITYRLRNKLEARLSAALASRIPEVDQAVVQFTHFAQDPTTGRLRVVFHAHRAANGVSVRQTNGFAAAESPKPTSAPEKPDDIIQSARAVTILRGEKTMIDEFHIDRIDSLYCQLDCSGHGSCNNFTKQCDCEPFWMANPISTYLMSGRREDCAWSSLYFYLSMCMLSIVVCFSCYFQFARRGWKVRSKVHSSIGDSRIRRRRRRKPARPSEDEEGTPMVGSARSHDPKTASSALLLISSDSLDSSSDDGEVAEASLYFRPSEETKATKRAVLKPKILDRDNDFLS